MAADRLQVAAAGARLVVKSRSTSIGVTPDGIGGLAANVGAVDRERPVSFTAPSAPRLMVVWPLATAVATSLSIQAGNGEIEGGSCWRRPRSRLIPARSAERTSRAVLSAETG